LPFNYKGINIGIQKGIHTMTTIAKEKNSGKEISKGFAR
jgi:hypothetical protein